MERTLCLIKPDAVSSYRTGSILARIEDAGLRITALRMLRLDKTEAEGFYAVHRERPFFAGLVRFMCSGPIVAALLEGDDAIARYRKLMGATNPADAEPGTLRNEFASDIERNAVHGSDGSETAASEIRYFFRDLDRVAES